VWRCATTCSAALPLTDGAKEACTRMSEILAAHPPHCVHVVRTCCRTPSWLRRSCCCSTRSRRSRMLRATTRHKTTGPISMVSCESTCSCHSNQRSAPAILLACFLGSRLFWLLLQRLFLPLLQAAPQSHALHRLSLSSCLRVPTVERKVCANEKFKLVCESLLYLWTQWPAVTARVCCECFHHHTHLQRVKQTVCGINAANLTRK
jgi:hypothetical protein